MASITVSDDVLEQIRSLRESRGETDDEILRRVLSGVLAERERLLKDYEKSDQDVQSTN